MIIQFVLLAVVLSPLVALMVYAAFFSGPHGGSWVKEDGTIIEWDGDGGGRILHRDGRLEEFPKR